MEPTNEAAVMTAESTEGKKGIPGSTLKIIAIVTMFIDHFAAVILDSYLMKHGMAEINATNVTDQAAIQAAADWMAQYGTIYYIDMFMRCIGRGRAFISIAPPYQFINCFLITVKCTRLQFL